MNALINAFLTDDLARYARDLAEFDRQIPADSEPDNDALVDQLAAWIQATCARLARLEEVLPKDQPNSIRDLKARFRETIWPWFGKSWFMQRAFSKPQGYPGDYEMLTGIYHQNPKSLGLGGCLDRYFLNSTLARAVRSRMAGIRGFLEAELAQRDGKISILDVACGPCREYWTALPTRPGQEVTITCVDSDLMALDFAKRQVAGAATSEVSFRFAQHNALRMISAAANIRRFGTSDIIYSVGLCDYIPDEFLVPMLSGWRQSVGEDGVVYVAFKDCRFYDKTEYQWFVDWYFFQRTEEDCRALFERAGYNMSDLTMTRDETSVIISFIGRDSARGAVRVDSGQKLPLRQHVEPISAPTAYLPQAR